MASAASLVPDVPVCHTVPVDGVWFVVIVRRLSRRSLPPPSPSRRRRCCLARAEIFFVAVDRIAAVALRAFDTKSSSRFCRRGDGGDGCSVLNADDMTNTTGLVSCDQRVSIYVPATSTTRRPAVLRHFLSSPSGPPAAERRLCGGRQDDDCTTTTAYRPLVGRFPLSSCTALMR